MTAVLFLIKKDAVSSTTLSPLYPSNTQPLHKIDGLLLDGQREAVLLEDELLFIEESTDPSDQGQSWRMAVDDELSYKQKALQPPNSSTNGISIE